MMINKELELCIEEYEQIEVLNNKINNTLKLIEIYKQDCGRKESQKLENIKNELIDKEKVYFE